MIIMIECSSSTKNHLVAKEVANQLGFPILTKWNGSHNMDGIIAGNHMERSYMRQADVGIYLFGDGTFSKDDSYVEFEQFNVSTPDVVHDICAFIREQ